jgi:hypothetical protein
LHVLYKKEDEDECDEKVGITAKNAFKPILYCNDKAGENCGV